MTIAISVLFSAFNALTLELASLRSCFVHGRKPTGCYADLTGLTVFEPQAPVTYVGWSAPKETLVMAVLLVAFGVAAGSSPMRADELSFDEDRGYTLFPFNSQRSFTGRTTAVVDSVERSHQNTPGVQNSTCFIGFSLLSFVRTTYNDRLFASTTWEIARLAQGSNFRP